MEFKKITDIFISNGYIERVILNNIKHKIAKFNRNITFGRLKCPDKIS